MDKTLLTMTAISCAALLSPAAAQNAEPDDKPVVVEMFLSQSCGACPPAAAYLVELAARNDIVALGWHVDYWNALNTKRGRWSDPFSAAEFTYRQKLYNKRIRHRSSVYTPQIVLNGHEEAIGSERSAVEAFLSSSKARKGSFRIVPSRTGEQVIFDFKGNVPDAQMFLVTFIAAAETKVPRGENADIVFADVNIVTGISLLGGVDDGFTRVSAPLPEPGKGCALIVQEPDLGRVFAASYCAD